MTLREELTREEFHDALDKLQSKGELLTMTENESGLSYVLHESDVWQLVFSMIQNGSDWRYELILDI